MSEKILIVDDDPSIVSLLRENLEAEGYVIVEGYDGLVGLELAKTELPNLIIIDVNLPGMSGPKVYDELRKTDSTKLIPLIFLTGDDSRESVPSAANPSLMARLKKPFDLDSLNAVVRQLLKQ